MIRGGKVVNDDGVVEADVLVDAVEGTILAVGNDIEVTADCKVRINCFEVKTNSLKQQSWYFVELG